jgi:hypothetical protein
MIVNAKLQKFSFSRVNDFNATARIKARRQLYSEVPRWSQRSRLYVSNQSTGRRVCRGIPEEACSPGPSAVTSVPSTEKYFVQVNKLLAQQNPTAEAYSMSVGVAPEV